jgi:hypothetical protein
MKLPIAMKYISEKYSQQWVAIIYKKKMTNYVHFKQAITEYLWSPHIQSVVRCWIYQDRFSKNGGEILRIICYMH